MNINHRSALLSGACVALLIAGQATAGSFSLKERSATAQGASFAGASSNGSDISYAGFNPAAFRAAGDHYTLSGSLSVIALSTEGTISSGGTVDPGTNGLVPNFYLARRFSDDLVAGISVYSPFGLKTEYPDGWVGAGDGTLSDLKSVAFSPTVAYNVAPNLTFGAAINIYYLDAKLFSSAAELEGDAVEIGGNIGILWDVTPSTTIGATYQTGYKVDADGTVGPFPASFQADLPATISVGVTHQVNPQWKVMGEVMWQDWSVFDAINVTTPGGTSADPQNYDDAVYVALGAEYDYAPNVTLRGGIGWDQTPTNADPLIPATPITNRTVRVPDEDRIWLSLGGSYQTASGMYIDAAYSYLFALDDSRVGLRDAAPTTVDYDATAHILSIGARMEF